MRTNQAQPHIAILLCTYNGQNYLSEQLNSFEKQTYQNWSVYASDDGSQDATIEILKNYQKKWGDDRLQIHTHPKKNFVENFLSLVCNTNIHADYYSYSDQDDIWEHDKLQRAVNWLLTIPKHIPALYCTRTKYVDMNNQDISLSPHFKKPPSFSNALIQSIAGGNTMVFNDATRNLLCKVGADIPVVSHDWWTYIVVSGCGGKIFYDQYPSLRYRQHGNNLIGMNSNWMARLLRVRLLFKGRFKAWNECNLGALHKLYADLTPENQKIFDAFSKARKSWILPRLLGLKKSGIYRQTHIGQLGLILAAIYGKI